MGHTSVGLRVRDRPAPALTGLYPPSRRKTAGPPITQHLSTDYVHVAPCAVCRGLRSKLFLAELLSSATESEAASPELLLLMDQ